MNTFTMRRETKVWASVVAVAMLVCSIGFANTTNAIPYVESFEAYAAGTQIAGTDGWYGISNAVEVAAEDPGFAWGYPIPAATHSNVLELTEPVTNQFARYTPADPNQSVYIDILVDPIPRENPPGDLPTDVQTAMYLGENGKLNIYHSTYAAVGAKIWSELDHTPLPTGEWVRVTLEMKYALDVWGGGSNTDKYFRVSVNGGTPLAGAYGYEALPLTNNMPTNATWFLQVGSGNGGGNPYLTSLSTEGPGAIDDVVVTTNTPAAGGPTTAFGVPLAWFPDPNNPTKDTDGDGSPDWAEWVAGTDATNGNSFLKFIAASGSGTIAWNGTTNTGGSATYAIYRNEDLVNDGWSIVASGIPKGTTTWTDPSPPADNANYKLGIPWEYTD